MFAKFFDNNVSTVSLDYFFDKNVGKISIALALPENKRNQGNQKVYDYNNQATINVYL